MSLSKICINEISALIKRLQNRNNAQTYNLLETTTKRICMEIKYSK